MKHAQLKKPGYAVSSHDPGVQSLQAWEGNMNRPLTPANGNSWDLKEYLKSHNLHFDLKISPSGNISFHWSDWMETCRWQAHQLKHNSSFAAKRQEIIDNIEMIKNIPIWVDKSGRKSQLTLYDLYKAYLDPRMRSVLFEGVNDRFLISFQGAQGPFIDARSLRWFEKDLYQNFVFLGLMDNEMPLRKFRLRFSVPVDFLIQEDKVVKVVRISCHQVTKEGLFWLLPRHLLEQILDSRTLLVKVNFNMMLKELIQLDYCQGKIPIDPTKLNNLNNRDSHDFHQFYLNFAECLRSDFDFGCIKDLNRQDFYIFTRFDLIRPAAEYNFIDHLLRPFVAEVENNFTRQLKALQDNRAA